MELHIHEDVPGRTEAVIAWAKMRRKLKGKQIEMFDEFVSERMKGKDFFEITSIEDLYEEIAVMALILAE